METDVIFKHLGHQTIDSAAHSSELHKDARAFVFFALCSLNRIELSADFFSRCYSFNFSRA
jgi:hypothetical protein